MAVCHNNSVISGHGLMGCDVL